MDMLVLIRRSLHPCCRDWRSLALLDSARGCDQSMHLCHVNAAFQYLPRKRDWRLLATHQPPHTASCPRRLRSGWRYARYAVVL